MKNIAVMVLASVLSKIDINNRGNDIPVYTFLYLESRNRFQANEHMNTYYVA